ncbi:MAG: hypothetical protein CVU89_01515 [Firmicutes bacterium HGW-Firmicutes-14]|nr:MAG: hypothetical protein CVU89_01515 [Firmicutes bacterium HGW-Firmicutes-14]
MVENQEYSVTLDKLDSYPVLGKGAYGKVYKLDEGTCVKVNKDIKINKNEVELYKKYKNCPLFPKFYGCGENYIVMELIKGESLESYLTKGKSLDKNILQLLVKMFEEGKKAGLRLNPYIRHIILTPENCIKLVDIKSTIRHSKNKLASGKSILFLKGLNEYGQKQVFLEYVKNNHEWLINQWNNV